MSLRSTVVELDGRRNTMFFSSEDSLDSVLGLLSGALQDDDIIGFITSDERLFNFAEPESLVALQSADKVRLVTTASRGILHASSAGETVFNFFSR